MCRGSREETDSLRGLRVRQWLHFMCSVFGKNITEQSAAKRESQYNYVLVFSPPFCPQNTLQPEEPAPSDPKCSPRLSRASIFICQILQVKTVPLAWLRQNEEVGLGKDDGCVLQRLIEMLGVSLSAGQITSTRGWTATIGCASSTVAICHLFPNRALKPWSLRVSMTDPVCFVSFSPMGSEGSYNSFMIYRFHNSWSLSVEVAELQLMVCWRQMSLQNVNMDDNERKAC